jgi:hypothetical protein
MYELIAPVLYKDCTLGNYTDFAAGLRKNENIDRTTRLHVYQNRHWGEATYLELITFGWHLLEMGEKTSLDGIPGGLDGPGLFQDITRLVNEGKRLRQFITEGITVLPNLQVVVTGGLGETVFNEPRAVMLEQLYSCHFDSTSKILPHALIDLPSVQHYCQTVAFGPFALPNRIIQPVSSNIQTYTQHERGEPMFSQCLTLQSMRSPPVILGASNRYYCYATKYVRYPLDPRMYYKGAESLLRPIVAMLDRPVYTADPSTGEAVQCKDVVNSDMTKDTQVVIYNYIRLLEREKLQESSLEPVDPFHVIESLPPLNLLFFQAFLEHLLPEAWKGKVRLANREEAPPCAGCGHDMEGELQISLKGYRSGFTSNLGADGEPA